MKKTKPRVHRISQYLLDPTHPITFNVIGAGGNGSQVLSQLARMDAALKALQHPGLYVRVFDADSVSEANLARQLFSRNDLGQNKASVLVTRINRFFNTSWKAFPMNYSKDLHKEVLGANFTISCVDSVKARKQVWAALKGLKRNGDPYLHPYYWMDLGNAQHTGQFVLGTLLNQKGRVNTLPNVFEKFPEFSKQRSKQTGPSCSLAEALNKQDLFINSTLVQLAMQTIWKLFRETEITYHGAFINLQTLQIATISI